MKHQTVTEIWAAIKRGEWRQPTAGLAPRYTQANVVILPKQYAFDFLLYCYRNEKPCPVVDVSDPGDPSLPAAGPQADIRWHVPKYRVYRHGRLDAEVDRIDDLYTDDMVTFLLGCSFTFEEALLEAHIPVRHIELSRNVPMYVTNIPTIEAGPFAGPLVVSMRPMSAADARRATDITAPFRKAHGAPAHMGDPAAIGIGDLQKVDFGDPPVMRDGEIPVFWACGVTPQMAIRQARPEIAITHVPGHMFITIITGEALRGQ